MLQNIVNVGVSGLGGRIGKATVHKIASGLYFGPDTYVVIQGLEVPEVIPKLKGLAMELEDCAYPLLKSFSYTHDPNIAFKDVNWALLIGASPRKEGMTRGDLLGVNGKIFAPQGRAINDNSASDIRVLVVGNPANTNTLIAKAWAKDIPGDRFYAMTMLDENRGRVQIAKRFGKPVSSVENLIVWGNHSKTQYPDFHHILIEGKPLSEFIEEKDEQWLNGEFIATVQNRGATIIDACGLSSCESAEKAIMDTVHSLIHDTSEGRYFSVAQCSKGEYGADEGLVFSFPSQTLKRVTRVVEDVNLNAFGLGKFQLTLDELRVERLKVLDLDLLPK